jgi:hypothetical protein
MLLQPKRPLPQAPVRSRLLPTPRQPLAHCQMLMRWRQRAQRRGQRMRLRCAACSAPTTSSCRLMAHRQKRSLQSWHHSAS